MGINVPGGLVVGMADQLHGQHDVHAVFPAEGNEVMTHRVGRDQGAVFASDVVRRIIVLDRCPGYISC